MHTPSHTVSLGVSVPCGSRPPYPNVPVPWPASIGVLNAAMFRARAPAFACWQLAALAKGLEVGCLTFCTFCLPQFFAHKPMFLVRLLFLLSLVTAPVPYSMMHVPPTHAHAHLRTPPVFSLLGSMHCPCCCFSACMWSRSPSLSWKRSTEYGCTTTTCTMLRGEEVTGGMHATTIS
jgi:hypothetical protein